MRRIFSPTVCLSLTVFVGFAVASISHAHAGVMQRSSVFPAPLKGCSAAVVIPPIQSTAVLQDRITSSIFLFQEPQFWGNYKWHIIGAVSLIILQTLLIVWLLFNRIRRRQAEEASKESEARYRNVVDTQTELICRFLPDTTLTFVNEAYCRHFVKPATS